jgi:DNA-binding MarR family transcriptional regulator
MEENGPVGEQLNYALAEGVLRVNEALQHTIAALMGEVDLTEPLANVLWQLGPDERPLSRRELAQRLDCDPSNVTFLVDRLEEKGLVKRAVDPHDRRVKAVSLTAAGATVRKQLVAATAAAPVFAVLTKAQKQQLIRLLRVCLEGAEQAQRPEDRARPVHRRRPSTGSDSSSAPPEWR